MAEMATFHNTWGEAAGRAMVCDACGATAHTALELISHQCPGPFDVYADGGVIRRNPSRLGGTWAWVHVRAEEEIAGGAGFITPAEAGNPTVTNNYTEFLALLLALEAVPDGWAGRAFSDSQVTLRRFQGQGTNAGIPDGLWQRMRALRQRLGDFKLILLGGHPTVEELRCGMRRDGHPCSRWNVLCDQRCGQQAGLFLASHAGGVLTP